MAFIKTTFAVPKIPPRPLLKHKFKTKIFQITRSSSIAMHYNAKWKGQGTITNKIKVFNVIHIIRFISKSEGFMHSH